VTFTPCFLWIFLGAPYIETLRGNRALSGALAAITAAVVGVILNLALWFAIHTIFAQVRTIAWGPLEVEVPVPGSVDPWALLLAAAAMVAMFRLQWGMLPTLGATAAAGIALHAAGAIA
jgi:chromate transporter